MKKSIMLGLGACALALGGVALASNSVINVSAANTTVYFNAGKWVDLDLKDEVSPNYFAYYTLTGGGSGWSQGAAASGKVYQFSIPDNYNLIIFVRTPRTTGTFDDKYNQTEDLYPEAGKDYYALSNTNETSGAFRVSTPYATTLSDGFYFVGDFNDWTMNAGSYSATGVWNNVSIANDQGFKVVKREYAYDTYYNAYQGGNAVEAGYIHSEGGDSNVYTYHTATYNIEFNDTTKKFSVEDVNYDAKKGYYICGSMNSWQRNDSYKQDAVIPDGYYCRFSNVTFEADSTFKIWYYKGLQRDDSSELGAYGFIAGQEGDAFTNDGYNNFKCVTAGTYDLRYKKSDGKLYIQDANRAAVRDFVSEYITAQAAEEPSGTADERKASCAAKYSAAKDALSTLTSAQKTLFSGDAEFASAYAAYQTWESSVPAAPGAHSIAQGDNNGSVPMLAIIGGVSVLSVGGLFLLRKRKAE